MRLDNDRLSEKSFPAQSYKINIDFTIVMIILLYNSGLYFIVFYEVFDKGCFA